MAEYITDMFLLTGKDKDHEIILIDTTIQRQDANLFDSSWRNKAKRFLAFKRNLNDDYVVTDILVIPEENHIPNNYARCDLTKDTREKGLRKHILCYKRDSRASVEKALTDIKVIAKGESLPSNYSSVSTNLNENQIIFKVDEIKRKIIPPSLAPQASQTTSVPQENNTPLSPGSLVTDLDGVLFEINPRFSTNLINNLNIDNMDTISVEDILKKYDYSFEKEKSVIKYVHDESKYSNSFLHLSSW